MTPGSAQNERSLRIAVLCGAASAPREYLRAAAEVGRLLAEQQVAILYGGGRLGLMGALADAALASGGHVTGIVTHALAPGVVHPALSELRLVADLSERRQQLAEQADAVIGLPGGVGTLEELTHVWASAARTGIVRPVGLLDTCRYFRRLISLVGVGSAAEFSGRQARLSTDDLLVVDHRPPNLVDAVVARARPLGTPPTREDSTTSGAEG